MDRRKFIGTALSGSAGACMAMTPLDTLGVIPVTWDKNDRRISVEGVVISPMEKENRYLSIWERYTEHSGLRRARYEFAYSSADFEDSFRVCYSEDNGRTWGAWKDLYSHTYERFGEHGQHERMLYYFTPDLYNPVHRNYIGTGIERIWKNGHQNAFAAYGQKGEIREVDHGYLCVRKEGSDDITTHLIKYEEGDDYNATDVLSDNYFNKNTGLAWKPWVMKNGDILVTTTPSISTCCRMLGIDAKEVFPSRPDTFGGLIVGRGTWNGAQYDLTFSRPVVISDLKSSRGVFEQVIAELNSGRIIVIFRGSNYRTESWNTRINPGTPGHKWFCYSDDGGKTFTEPVPWHYDNGEVIYSSATPSQFIRSSKNGKLYWFGNITDHRVEGNYPRYPFQMVEVDDTYGTAKRDTLTMIDTRREGESEFIQLTNFELLEDRETGDIECYLTKIGTLGRDAGQKWRGDAWRYHIHV